MPDTSIKDLLLHAFNHRLVAPRRRLEGLYIIQSQGIDFPDLEAKIRITTERVKSAEEQYMSLLTFIISECEINLKNADALAKIEFELPRDEKAA